RAKTKEGSVWRTPNALLVGKADLSRLCRRIEVIDPASTAVGQPEDRPLHDGDTVLRCTPRNGAGESADTNGSLREVLLETDPQARLVRVILREAGNIETEFRFGNWEENIPIPETQFHFQPPPGVTIIDEATLAGAIHYSEMGQTLSTVPESLISAPLSRGYFSGHCHMVLTASFHVFTEGPKAVC